MPLASHPDESSPREWQQTLQAADRIVAPPEVPAAQRPREGGPTPLGAPPDRLLYGVFTL
ncbi:MAG: hypothetical protein ACYTG2_08580 [Planctomycetota bacterium]